ncbi:MAG: hypothetical protein QW524_01540 [Candidatus Woesearchaeota archaeon]
MKDSKIYFLLIALSLLIFVGCEGGDIGGFMRSSQRTSSKTPLRVTLGAVPNPVYAGEGKISIPFFVENLGELDVKDFNISLISDGVFSSSSKSVSINNKSRTSDYLENIIVTSTFLSDYSTIRTLQMEYAYLYNGNAQVQFCVGDISLSYDPNKKGLCGVKTSAQVTSTFSHIEIKSATFETQATDTVKMEIILGKVDNSERLYPVAGTQNLINHLKDKNKKAKEGILLSISFDSNKFKEDSICYYPTYYDADTSSNLKDLKNSKEVYFSGNTARIHCYLKLTDSAKSNISSEPYTLMGVFELDFTYVAKGELSTQITVINPDYYKSGSTPSTPTPPSGGGVCLPEPSDSGVEEDKSR